MKAFVNYMQNLEKKQKIMIYLSVVLLLVVLLNQFLPPMMNQKESLQSNINTMQMQILKNSSKRLKRDLAKINQAKLEVIEKNDQNKEKIAHYMSNLYKVKFAFFTQKELAKSLDMILDESLDLGIELDFIKNTKEKVPDISDLIAYKNTLHISGFGDYKKTINFISFIESLDLLMKIEEITIEQSEKKAEVSFSLTLHVYGVGL